MRQYSIERLALMGRQVPRNAQLGAKRETRRLLQAWRRLNTRGAGPRNLAQENARRVRQLAAFRLLEESRGLISLGATYPFGRFAGCGFVRAAGRPC